MQLVLLYEFSRGIKLCVKLVLGVRDWWDAAAQQFKLAFVRTLSIR